MSRKSRVPRTCQSCIAKKEKKRLKLERSYKLLQDYQLHVGPVTPETLELLDKLTEKQIIKEVRYIRVSYNASIRESLKVNGKFEKLTRDQLIDQRRSILKPEGSQCKNLNDLFLNLKEYWILTMINFHSISFSIRSSVHQVNCQDQISFIIWSICMSINLFVTVRRY